MSGVVCLVGSGEFTPAMDEIDRGLLASTGRRRPRVALLPTASTPDGDDVFSRWAEMGRQHFSALGAEVEALGVRTGLDADDPVYAQAVGEADLVYLSGGKPDYLHEALMGSLVAAALTSAHDRGAIVVGCSAGAMALAEHRLRFLGQRGLPWRWASGLGFVAGAAIAPHYDSLPEVLLLPLLLRAPQGSTVVGLDGETALVGSDGGWQVLGRGRVTIWRGRRRTRHRAGEVVRF